MRTSNSQPRSAIRQEPLIMALHSRRCSNAPTSQLAQLTPSALPLLCHLPECLQSRSTDGTELCGAP